MNNTRIPTHLFVGSETKLYQVVIKKLQNIFCKNKLSDSDCFCSECRKIKNNQHESVIWIEPEKNYLLSDLAVIFQKIRFSLEENKNFFFILQKAHLLTPVCANKLLKTLEEPPRGYNFFLLTNNEQSILPTIRSRCSIHHTQTQINDLLVHPLLSFFIDPAKRNDVFYFDQELRKQKISESETIELIHDLTNSIQKRLIEFQKKCSTTQEVERLAHDKNYRHLEKTITFLHEQLKKPPQAGGATLFWRKLFLMFPAR